MQAEGGAAGFVDIVARLLGATFGGPAAPIRSRAPDALAEVDRPPQGAGYGTFPRAPGGAHRPAPFPGTT